MAISRLYTPCKDNNEGNCANYPNKCEDCTHKHGFTILLSREHEDCFKNNK